MKKELEAKPFRTDTRIIYIIQFNDGTYVGNHQNRVPFKRARIFTNKSALVLFIQNWKKRSGFDDYSILEFHLDNSF